MNIFVTSINPKIAAQDHCDVHLRKMIVETAQLLATAHFEFDGEIVAYKPTHKNHPCAVWVREHPANYQWAVSLLRELLQEYTYRTGKVCKTQEHYENLSRPLFGMRNRIYTRNAIPLSYVLAMPDEFKSKSVEKSYQDYLNCKYEIWIRKNMERKALGLKPRHCWFVEWKNREIPVWVSDHVRRLNRDFKSM